MQKNVIGYAGCPGPSLAISAQFTLKMFVEAGNRKKITRTPYFVGSMSFKIIEVDTNKRLVSLVTIACHDKQHVCTYLQPFSHYTVSEKKQSKIF